MNNETIMAGDINSLNLLVLDAIYDSVNEGALLRSLIKSHCPCFEK